MTSKDGVAQLRALMLDGACRRVVQHLESAGHRPILLKGATVARWLYDDPTTRTYGDLDILVDPAERDPVVAALGQVGFRSLVDTGMLATSSTEEQPLADRHGIVIDLHIALKGVAAPPERAWRVLDRMTVPFDWTGTPVRALAPPARALHLALHVAQRGLVDGKAAEDLRRGLERLDRDTWRAALALADELEATGAMATGLSLLPDGERLLDELAVAPTTNRETRMRAASASTSALFVERAIAARTWRQRLRVVRGRLFPSAQWLRLHEPEASRTRWGMLKLRTQRPIRVVCRLPAALRERRGYAGPAVPAHQAGGQVSPGAD